MGRSNCAHFPGRRELLEAIYIEEVDDTAVWHIKRVSAHA
jgi:hypothetical protein